MIFFTEIQLDDIKFFNEVRNLSRDMLHDNSFYSLQESEEWYLKNKPAFYMIHEDSIGKIGYFRTSNFSIKNKNIYVGADLHPSFRGKGYSYEAYKKFISFLFEKHDLHKISLEVLESNKIAFNLYNKIGFKVEGIKRDEILRDNKFINSIVMSILKKEWNNE